jgi:hypothetical protein
MNRYLTFSLVIFLYAVDINAQDKNSNLYLLPQRKVSVEQLTGYNWVYSGSSTKTECKAFVCNYKEITQPIIHIEAFPSESVWADSSIYAFAPEFYKEVSEENIQHGRMRYRRGSVNIFITGDSAKYFLIDTARKAYLLQVLHANGLESWYYPVYRPNLQLNPKNAGEKIGESGGSYFWQIRFQNRSFLLSGILNKNFLPDSKGIFIENIKLAPISSSLRYKGFIASLKGNMNEKEQKQNYSDDFNQRMNDN